MRQLGFDPIETARRIAAAEAESGLQHQLGPAAEAGRLQGQGLPEPIETRPGDMSEVEYLLRTAFQEIWNWRRIDKVKDYYAPEHHARVSTQSDLYGHSEYQNFLLGLMAAIPDLAISIHHIAINGDESEGYRTATRWMLHGTHKGPGPYGPPSGRPVRLMSISHHEIKNGKFVQEWTIFDEFALLKQIYAPEI